MLNDVSNTYYSDELQHYGVLGMKWGVRRGNVSKAYEKASKKLDKLDDYVTKSQSRARARSDRYERLSGRRMVSNEKLAKAKQKARQSEAKAAQNLRNAERWYKSMEKTFKNTDIKMSADQIARGKKYTETLNNRAMMRSMMY